MDAGSGLLLLAVGLPTAAAVALSRADDGQAKKAAAAKSSAVAGDGAGAEPSLGRAIRQDQG